MNNDNSRDAGTWRASLAAPIAPAQARAIDDVKAKATMVRGAARAELQERARIAERCDSRAAGLQWLEATAKKRTVASGITFEVEAREREIAVGRCGSRAGYADKLDEATARERALVPSIADHVTSRVSASEVAGDPVACIAKSAHGAGFTALKAATRRSPESALAATPAYAGAIEREVSLRAGYREPPPMEAFTPLYHPYHPPMYARPRLIKVGFEGSWKPFEMQAVKNRLEEHHDLDSLCECEPRNVIAFRTSRPLDVGGSLRMVTFVCGCHRSRELVEWPELSAARRGPRIVDDEYRDSE